MQIGYRLLQALSARADVEVHLVITEGARLTFEHETDLEMAQVEGLADVVWDNRDQAAAISSGSFETGGNGGGALLHEESVRHRQCL